MRLSEERKRWIVMRLAMFGSPSEVAEEFDKEFGKKVSNQLVWSYDATKSQNRQHLTKDLVELFEATRKEYLSSVEDVAIAHTAHRMRVLDRMLRDQLKKANPNNILILSILEQSAKESGNAYSNKVKLEHTGKDGSPIQGFGVVGVGLSSAADTLTELLNRARERTAAPGSDASEVSE